MTHEDEGHYANKHPRDRKVAPEIAEAVKERAPEGSIACAAAFKVVGGLNVEPSEVGFTIDSLEIKITHCQMGIFGYPEGKRPIKPPESVPDDLKKAIEGSLVEGKLPCKRAWEVAEEFRIGKMDVSSACETLKVKVSKCQLGAFK